MGAPGGLANADGTVRVAIPNATVDDVPAPAPTTTTAPGSTSTTSTTAPGSTTTAPTTTTTTPTATCAGSSTATFTDAEVDLPGGISLTGASGELSVVGVLIDSATITVPTNWGGVSLQVPGDGLLLPFVSTTNIGLPLGSLDGEGLPFTSPSGWAGTTTVTFPSGGASRAAIDATAAPTGAGAEGHLAMTGSTTGAGTTQLQIRADGLVGLGPVDVPIAGTLATTGATSPVTSTVTGSVTGPVPLTTDVSVGQVALDWSPTAASGYATFDLGSTGSPLSVRAGVHIQGGSVGTAADLIVGLPPQSWAPGGPSGPLFVLSGSGTITGSGSDSAAELQLQLGGAAVGSWSPSPTLRYDQLVPTVAARCALDAKAACNPTATVSGSSLVAGPVGSGVATPTTGSLDMSTGVTTLTSSPGDLTVAPVAVSDTRLTVELEPAGPTQPSGSVVPSATGSSVVLGTSRSTTVTFAPGAVVAAATLSDLQPIPGWDLLGTVAVATTADTTYRFSGQQPVPVTAGVLTGAATTTMPTVLSDGVLPDAVTSGTITFPIAASGPATSPTSFTLSVGPPDGWYLLGSATSATATGAQAAPSLSIDTISYAIAVAGQAVTVSPSGTGTLAVPSVQGTTGGASPALTFTGGLSAGTDGGALSLTFATASAQPGQPAAEWSSPFGVSGLSLTDAQIQSTTTPTGTLATLAAVASLTPALAAVLGTPANASPSLTATLATGSGSCPTIDLKQAGIDLGGIGLVQAATASLELQPSGCAPAPGTAIPTGFGVSFSQQYLGSGTAPIDPTTSAVDADVSLPDAQIDGLSLSGSTVSITTQLPSTPGALPQLAMTVSGTTTLADQTVALTGPVSPPTPLQPVATIDLVSPPTSISIPSSTGDAGDDTGLVVTTPGLGVSVDATPGTGSPDLVLAGTTEVLGATGVDVWLSGAANESEITSLKGCVTGIGDAPPTIWTPDPCASAQPTTFPLPGPGDSLTTTVAIAYTATGAHPLAVSTPKGGATLVADGFTFQTGTAALTASGFSIDTTIVTPGSTTLPVALSGDYVIDPSGADAAAGDFRLATPSATELEFSGFAASGQAVFSRSDGTSSNRITASVAPGLFDQDTTVALTGDIEADGTSTLKGKATDVTFRGLAGTATFTISPGTQSSDPLTQALGLKGWYQTAVSFVTEKDQCDVWKGTPPTLAGTVYRTGPVTYYTLTGTTELVMPDGFELITGDDQPLTLSNEWVGGVDGQPAAGISVSKQWHTSTFTAVGALSIQPAQCSYGVSATAVFGFDQGAQAAQLHGAMVPPTGISYQSGGLWGTGGSLPPDIEVTRTALEWQSLNAALAAAQARANAVNTAMQRNLDDWTTAADEAQERLNSATDDLQAAQRRLAMAEAEAQTSASALARARAGDDQDAADYAEEAQYDAQDALNAAKSGLQAATASARTAGQAATETDTELQNAAAAADAAATDLADAKSQTQQNSTAKMVTIDFTHCETCSPVDTFSFGGEMFFDVVYVAGLDLTIGFDENAFDTIQGSITFGVQKQFSYGTSWIGVYASATGTVELTVGYNFNGDGDGTGWTQLDIGVDIQANLSAYLSALCFSYTTTLLAVDVTGSIDILPLPVTWQGSVSVDLWGYTVRAGFGPDEM